MDAPSVLRPQQSCDGRRRAALGVLVTAWGVQAIVTQSLLLREALVLMFGSEFAWGIVLFAWLLGVAVGAAVGGWAAERLTRTDAALVVVLLALSAAACVELWIFRGARAWLDVGPGELLPLPKTALAAMLFVSPTSALIGLAFPLACCVGRSRSANCADPAGNNAPRSEPYLSFGQVYALESAGSLVGGAAFSFWAVEYLTPIQTALACAALTLAAAAGLLLAPPKNAGRGRRWPLAGAALAVVALAAVVVAVFAGDVLNGRLVDRRWQTLAPGYELVAETESKYQNLAVGRRAGQFTLYCDGQVAADFPDPYTFVPLAHFWLCQHPSPREVLVLGGGVEGLLAEILRHPVEHIDYVEPDPRQIELVEPYLANVDRQALRDPRVAVHHVDARYYVKTQRDRFDLVIARLPEPMSAQRARFYTDEFYSELRRSMRSGAVLCMTAAAAPGELSAASREYLASIRATLRRHFPQIVVGWDHPAQVLAATKAGLISTEPAELAGRYARRGVASELFRPAWFEGATDWLEAAKLARRAADLDRAKEIEVSTDLRPAVYVQRLELWEALTGSSRVVGWLRSVRLPGLVTGLAVVGAITVVVCRLRRRRREGWATGAITLSVGTTGFATMALSIVWLFAFQNLYGYVYQRIGWIIALFMAGLVIGCGAASWRLSRVAEGERLGAWLWQRLVLVDVLMALLALAVPYVLPALGAAQGSAAAFVLVEWCVSVMVLVTGLLGGAAFALAARLQFRYFGRTGAAAGSVDAADHAGACLGALLCGILLVPVFGTTAAAFLLGGMKLGSAGMLLAGWRAGR